MRAGTTQGEMENITKKRITSPEKLGNKDVSAQKQKLTQKSAQRRAGKPVMSRKEKEDAKMRKLELERQRRKNLEVTLPEEITVGDLAARLHVTSGEIIKRLMTLGVMASVNEVIDFDTASMVAMEIGAKSKKKWLLPLKTGCLRWKRIRTRTCPSVRRSLWLWVTSTTARPLFSTPSAMPM
jgi:translation initiation factor IF-2